MAKKRTPGLLFPMAPADTPAVAVTPPPVDGAAALKIESAPPATSGGPSLELVQPGGHPGQRDPFYIPAGADPASVAFWTDMRVPLGNSSEYETPEEAEGNLWLVLWGRASETNPELASVLYQLRAWGCRLAWTPRGNLRLNWRPALARVPETVCSVQHRMEVLARNQSALLGVPEELHGRLVTLLERYLEPFRDELARLFRATTEGWPEEARW